MTKLVDDRVDVLSRYDTYTLQELINLLTMAVDQLPSNVRESARFTVDLYEPPYDGSSYPKLFLEYARPETEIEKLEREINEARAEQLALQRERAEFERLKAKFG